jgi:hypothetical protein
MTPERRAEIEVIADRLEEMDWDSFSGTYTADLLRELLAEIDQLKEDRWAVPCLPCMGYSKTSYQEGDEAKPRSSRFHSARG